MYYTINTVTVTTPQSTPERGVDGPRGGPDTQDTSAILDALATALDEMPPQVGQAARYVIDNSGEIAVTSMRALATAAEVKPNTFVRMARTIGFEGYEDFRAPFRQEAADGTISFPDRARWLQTIKESGNEGALLAEMASSALGNTETLFTDLKEHDFSQLRSAAASIAAARRVNVLGVGTARPLAENFAYVGSMILDNLAVIPAIGLAIDDIAKMSPDEDVLLAMTFSPYRAEIVTAVELACARGIDIIAISDSRASPIYLQATTGFCVPNGSPFPFSSNVAATALLETLLAFVTTEVDTDPASAIEAFHNNRHAAGIYR